jgi:DNA-binding NarL/FixJ family response regulator
MRRIRVLLADDHTVVRQGIRALLSAEDDIEIVGEADNGRHAVELVEKVLPDVALVDIAMPVLNGIEATRRIARKVPATKVLVLTSYGDGEYVRQVMEAGASGFLVKQTAANELANAIRETHQGKSVFSPSVARVLRHTSAPAISGGRWTKRRDDGLSEREAEVLQLIAEGALNKQIAAELGISVKTVEKHRQRVMKILGIHDVAGLTRYAISIGMIESPAGRTGIQGPH